MQDSEDKKGLSLYNISKDQTLMLKGFGMICIVLHNFFHWTHKAQIGENEFRFFGRRIYNYAYEVMHHPDFFINALFSFWGHFGVQIFVFASGYGLAKQFMKNKPSSYKNYILPRLLKIYALMIVGLICYFLLLYPNMAITWNTFLGFVKSSLLLYNNFSYDTIFFFPYSGTWWYFSLIIQLYLIFPILYFIVDRYREKGFFITLIISYLLIYGLLPLAEAHNIPIYGNFIGHIPEFLLGIGLAKFKDFRLSYKVVFPIALVIFTLSNFFKYIHPLGYLAVTIVMLMILIPLYGKLSGNFSKSLLFVGQISMFVFVINSPLRSYTIPHEISTLPQFIILLKALVHVLFTFGISYLVWAIYGKTVSPALNRITGKLRK